MLNVLMLGNGFDLYHKLLTDYDNFITIGTYLRKKHTFLTFENFNVYSVLKEISKNNKSIRESLLLYKEAYAKTNINCEEYGVFLELLNTNCWFQYFADRKERDGWVALEIQIYELLKKIKKNDISDAEPFLQMIKEKNGCSDKAFKYIKSYTFSKQENDNILFDEFEKFINLLQLYLKIFVNNVLQHISQSHCFENSFLNNSDVVISFNYTDTYKQLYSSNTDVVYIHGKLGGDIIVGINSDECDNIGNNDLRFIKFKKYYQRITKHTFAGIRKLITHLKLTDSNKHLKVIGHSLDLADEDIITVIFDWFDIITIYYLDDQALDKYVKNLKQIFGAKTLSEMTFSQKIIFEKIPSNNYKKVTTNDQL